MLPRVIHEVDKVVHERKRRWISVIGGKMESSIKGLMRKHDNDKKDVYGLKMLQLILLIRF